MKLSITCLGIIFLQHSGPQSDGGPRVLFPMDDANPPVEVHVKDAETRKGALGRLWPLFWSQFFDTWGDVTSSLGLSTCEMSKAISDDPGGLLHGRVYADRPTGWSLRADHTAHVFVVIWGPGSDVHLFLLLSNLYQNLSRSLKAGARLSSPYH